MRGKIAIASGKGGTGKTTVAVNLAAFLAGRGCAVDLVDCDVEEPNAHLFLKTEWTFQRQESLPVPEAAPGCCRDESCRVCVDLCRFKALIRMAGSLLVFPELCHGCGLCLLACPERALGQGSRRLGLVRFGSSGNVRVHGGRLRVGEAMATPLIRAVKADAELAPLQIWDCPPGTACPVIAALDGADFVVLVAEPTAFGLHDLTLAVELVRGLGLRCGAVINRHGLGDDRVERFLEQAQVPVLARLPFSRQASEAAAGGHLLVEAVPGMSAAFQSLWRNIEAHLPEVVS